MSLPDVPLSREAVDFRHRIMPRIKERLAEVERVPVGVLLWGPGLCSGTPMAEVRGRLRTTLRVKGHAAFFSEELCDGESSASLRLQELAQAQEFDLIVCLPSSSGPLAELHDFAVDRRVSAKMLVFINQDQLDGYSTQSLQAVSSLVSAHLIYYPGENDTEVIEEVTLEEAQKLREMKYILAGRY